MAQRKWDDAASAPKQTCTAMAEMEMILHLPNNRRAWRRHPKGARDASTVFKKHNAFVVVVSIDFWFDTIEIESSKPVSISGTQFMLNSDSR